MITTKKEWLTPVINAHQIGGLNKFGRQSTVQKNYSNTIDSIPVEKLIERYGSPLFVTSEDKIRSNIRALKQAFEKRYPKVVHGWSYKTNYNAAVCNTFHQEGSWAEVVSGFEYEKARKLGVPARRIIFNGPNKSKKILERAVDEGAKLHLDRHDELLLVEQIARDKNTICKVTMRLNFDTGYTESWSRFGFNLESGEALDGAHYIHNSDHLQLNGLHSHIGTYILDTNAYAAQVTIMCDFMAQVENETDALIESLDIGGGFASKNSLQGLYLPPEQTVPDVEQYAEVICNALMEKLERRQQRGLALPTLILESGRAMIDDAQTLLTSVVGNRKMADGRSAVILDAGVNLLFTGFWFDHPVSLSRPVSGVLQETVLYGPLCMNIDVVRKSIQLPPLPNGEILQVGCVGAYNNTQWMQFIEYRPNVVMIHGDDQCETAMGEEKPVSIIRHAEDLNVMVAQEQLPDHLSQPFLLQDVSRSAKSVGNANEHG